MTKDEAIQTVKRNPVMSALIGILSLVSIPGIWSAISLADDLLLTQAEFTQFEKEYINYKLGNEAAMVDVQINQTEDSLYRAKTMNDKPREEELEKRLKRLEEKRKIIEEIQYKKLLQENKQ